MSLALWLWRVFWDGNRGAVVRGNVRTILSEPPEIPGVEPFEMIDYAPKTVYMIRHVRGKLEEMTDEEIRACDRFLGLGRRIETLH